MFESLRKWFAVECNSIKSTNAALHRTASTATIMNRSINDNHFRFRHDLPRSRSIFRYNWIDFNFTSLWPFSHSHRTFYLYHAIWPHLRTLQTMVKLNATEKWKIKFEKKKKKIESKRNTKLKKEKRLKVNKTKYFLCASHFLLYNVVVIVVRRLWRRYDASEKERIHSVLNLF